MYYIFYAFVVLISTILGSLAGLGGGVIIKPFLDVLGFHDILTISFYSSCAVFTMALFSTLKNNKSKSVDKYFTYCMCCGSVAGGYFGNQLFNLYNSVFINVKVIQSIISIMLLISILILTYINIYFNMKINKLSGFVCGMILGTLSSFLGVGGGPYNVALLINFFGFDIKKAAQYSIVIILFTQVSNLFTTLYNYKINIFDLSFLWVIIPSAIVGGKIGLKIREVIKERYVKIIYIITVLFVIALNIINLI